MDDGGGGGGGRLRAHLCDGEQVTLDVARDETCGAVCERLAREAGVAEVGAAAAWLALFAVEDGRLEALSNEERAVDAAERCRRIVLRLAVISPACRRSRDPGVRRLRYAQAVYDVAAGLLPCPDEALHLQLAALLLRKRFGLFVVGAHSPRSVVAMLLELVPLETLRGKRGLQLAEQVLDRYQTLPPACDPVRDYLKTVGRLELYGKTLVDVEVAASTCADVPAGRAAVLAVAWDGLSLLDDDSLVVLQRFPWALLASWGVSESGRFRLRVAANSNAHEVSTAAGATIDLKAFGLEKSLDVLVACAKAAHAGEPEAPPSGDSDTSEEPSASIEQPEDALDQPEDAPDEQEGRPDQQEGALDHQPLAPRASEDTSSVEEDTPASRQVGARRHAASGPAHDSDVQPPPPEQAPSEAEQAPSEAEQESSEAEQESSEAEQESSEAKQAPSEAEQTSSEAEQAPSEAEETPTEAEQAPSEAEQARSEAEETPSEAEQEAEEKETASPQVADDQESHLHAEALRESKEFQAAVLLQACARGVLQRKRVDEELASMRVQALWRMYRARVCVRELREERDASNAVSANQEAEAQARACERVQAFYRGYRARREFWEMEREVAATYAQAIYRGHSVRKKLAESAPPPPPPSPPPPPTTPAPPLMPPPGLDPPQSLAVGGAGLENLRAAANARAPLPSTTARILRPPSVSSGPHNMAKAPPAARPPAPPDLPPPPPDLPPPNMPQQEVYEPDDPPPPPPTPPRDDEEEEGEGEGEGEVAERSRATPRYTARPPDVPPPPTCPPPGLDEDVTEANDLEGSPVLVPSPPNSPPPPNRKPFKTPAPPAAPPPGSGMESDDESMLFSV